MTEHELLGATRHLTAAGLLWLDGGRLILTERGSQLMEQTAGGSWFEEWDRLTPILAQLSTEDVPGAQAPFPEGAHEKAVAAYKERAARWIDDSADGAE
jgi:hypothetical protein